MANDTYVNSTGLTYFWNRIKTVFAKQADLTTLSGRVDDLVAEGGEPNVIESISVNSEVQSITNKAVNISVPTNTSDLTNDVGYQTASEVQAAINAAVTSAYIYKGSVATLDDLPASGQTSGDVYDVQATGMNYAWNGTAWDALGQYVDTSLFILASDMTAITTAQIDEITSVSSAEE